MRFQWNSLSIPAILVAAGAITALVRSMFSSRPLPKEEEVGRWESEGGQAEISETNPVPQAKRSRAKLAAVR